MAQKPRKTLIIEVYKAATALVFALLFAGSAAAGVLGWGLDMLSPTVALALAIGGPVASIGVFGPIFVMFDNNDLLHAIAENQITKP
ncbi:hypothetical protein [Pseudogemmobacter humi]|uniref:Uncharacterized protein n=1 Tax=Pseudogemmobacter humi TaxID=2483812 RepID=A0A3P5XI95_9RHOB|nr:hypothetical protein [Pseudogemmobacter humi]VDC28248.1 hypothetical protein XINFAN_02023 [Pseudogemmobacter humi]